jgi:hypothetical protein
MQVDKKVHGLCRQAGERPAHRSNDDMLAGLYDSPWQCVHSLHEGGGGPFLPPPVNTKGDVQTAALPESIFRIASWALTFLAPTGTLRYGLVCLRSSTRAFTLSRH